MTEPIETEIWLVSKVNKAHYPTGNPEVPPRKMNKDIPFRVFKSKEVVFFKNLVANNPNGFLKIISKGDAQSMLNAPSTGTLGPKYAERHTNATKEIDRLQDIIKTHEQKLRAKETEIMELKDNVKELNEAVDLEGNKQDEIEKLMAQNVKLMEANKKLKSENKKLKKLNKNGG